MRERKNGTGGLNRLVRSRSRTQRVDIEFFNFLEEYSKALQMPIVKVTKHIKKFMPPPKDFKERIKL